MLVVVDLDAEEAATTLVVGRHRHLLEELLGRLGVDSEIVEDLRRVLGHDVLGAGAGGHAGHLGPDRLADDRFVEGPLRDRPGIDLDHLVAARLRDRGLALDHELRAHDHLGPIRVLVPVEEPARHRAAELLDLGDVALDRLLQHLVDHLEVPREVRPLERAGKIDEDVELGDEDDRALVLPRDLDQFLDVLHADARQVDADVGAGGLDIW